MKPKYAIGQVVRTIKGWFEQTEGPVYRVVIPDTDMILLWGTDELHYLVKDNQTGDFLSVIERGIEKR